jgi:hypothetical protein
MLISLSTQSGNFWTHLRSKTFKTSLKKQHTELVTLKYEITFRIVTLMVGVVFKRKRKNKVQMRNVTV